MRKNSSMKGQRGLGARGQGKVLSYHTQIPEAAAARQAKDQQQYQRQQQERKQSDGRWT